MKTCFMWIGILYVIFILLAVFLYISLYLFRSTVLFKTNRVSQELQKPPEPQGYPDQQAPLGFPVRPAAREHPAAWNSGNIWDSI